MQTSAIIVFVGLLVFLAHLFEGIFERTKIPDVLLLIVIGLIFGPLLKLMSPDDFGVVGPVFIMVALAVILFQGGTRLRLDVLRRSVEGTATLTLASFIFSMAAVSAVSYLITDLGLVRSAILGSIVGGTSSAIVIPIVRQFRMKEESKTVLSLESALSDVLCIVVTLAIIESFVLGGFRLGFFVEHTISSLGVAALIGAVAAVLWSILLDQIRHMRNSIFTTPAFVFIIFGFVDLIGYSGAIAALAFGITLGNVNLLRLPLLRRYTPLNPVSLSKREKAFFSEVVFLLKTFFFIYIGISIQLTNSSILFLGLLITILLFVVRTIVVRIFIPRSYPAIDASLMASVAPKGLAAAVLATIPLQQGIYGGEFIRNLTYSVVLFSIILTSLLVFLVEKTALFKFYQKIFSSFSGVPRKPQEDNLDTTRVPPPLTDR